MTREEAYNRIDAIIAKYEIDDEYVTITNEKDYDALRMARKILEQEPCEDAISRQAVLDKKELVELEDGQSFYCISPEDVETLPSVTPQPKTGHWIDGHCSECGCDVPAYIIDWKWQKDMDAKYCPNCGIKMGASEG